ncbi:unnamed protein product [Owenia fusiformis]|uniref:protein-tyrosine-phosphatase n=1 Tax=Owenia fusiformis TaxID=6347 RepID=A0A8S4PFN1_OWEFU|nr:unnamed protein product [Owenia fusiformis]
MTGGSSNVIFHEKEVDVMPFGLKIKRTRRYNVSSKNLFVVCTQLLDTSSIECTLTSESTGFECLQSIAQRIELQQMQCFGLRYRNKKLQFRWVDLERPLKRQLDKHADNNLLYFGVMYYIIDAHLIEDEMARYQYYLQLKNDIIDGRLPCSHEQAVLVAGYSVQAEFGDFNEQKHTIDFYREYVLFPRNMTNDERILEGLTHELRIRHQHLLGIEPQMLEIQYILYVQQMEGYGVEYYPAKDEASTELLLGASVDGMFVNFKHVDEKPSIFYKWSSIKSLVSNKRNLGLQIIGQSKVVIYQMDDPETAKYVCKLCSLRHRFYTQTKDLIEDGTLTHGVAFVNEPNSTERSVDVHQDLPSLDQLEQHKDAVLKNQNNYPQSENQETSHHHPQGYLPNDPYPQGYLPNDPHPQGYIHNEQSSQSPSSSEPHIQSYTASDPAQYLHNDSNTQHYINEPQVHGDQNSQSYQITSDVNPQLYNQNNLYNQTEGHLPSYSTAVPNPQSYTSLDVLGSQFGASQASLEQPQAEIPYTEGLYTNLPSTSGDMVKGSQYSADSVDTLDSVNSGGNLKMQQKQGMAVSVTSLGYPPASTPPPPVPNIELPAYRPSPDYNHVMESRLRGMPSNQNSVQFQQQTSPQQLNQQHQFSFSQAANIGSSHVYSRPETMAYSQPEIGQSPPFYQEYLNSVMKENPQIYAQPFVDANGHIHYRPVEQVYRPRNPVDRSSSLIVHSTYANSSPDLHTQGLLVSSTSETMINEPMFTQPKAYKPPPPYNPRNSSSTPDLAGSQQLVASNNELTSLVSHRNINLTNELVVQSRLHHSVDNLAEAVESLEIPNSLNEIDRKISDSSSEHSNLTFVTKNLSRPSSVSVSHDMSISDMTPSPTTPAPVMGLSMIERLQREMQAQAMINQAPGSQQPQENNIQTMNSESNMDQASGSTHQNMNNVDPRLPPSLQALAAMGALPSPPPYRPPGVTKTINQNVGSFDSSDAESIQCLDTTRAQSEPSITHSKTSSLDTTSLSHNVDAQSLGPETRSLGADTISLTPQAEETEVVQMRNKRDSTVSSEEETRSDTSEEEVKVKRRSMGPLKMAAMNGLSMSRASMLLAEADDSRAPTDERRKKFENKLEDGQVFMEFEQIPKKREHCTCNAATHPENANRNRFREVYPYDDNRVKIPPSRSNSLGYINASHIKMHIASDDWLYIATQAPLDNTVSEFWQMIWESEVYVIAMLTEIQEQGKQKCCSYWPRVGDKSPMQFGDFQIYMQFCNKTEWFNTSRLTVKHLPSKCERELWHLQYTDWPEKGCPEDIHGFLAYLDEIDCVRRHAYSEHPDNKLTPILVHCSAGVGRTGVVILAEIMKACLERNETIEIPKVLRQLREQRMHIVQTVGQYSFVYRILIQYLKNSRLI